MKLNFKIKHFSELSVQEFHDIIKLRIDVFVVEQNCPYSDLDGKDENSYHFIGYTPKNEIAATCRILPKGLSYAEMSIGRFATSKATRQEGFGLKMMEEVLIFIKQKYGNESIRISAQKYLLKFYEKFGFVSTGKEYLEDDIPHVEMLFNI
jgi:ElaA protein